MILIDTSKLTTFFLVSIRLGTVLLFTPIEAIRLLPKTVRLFLLLILDLFIIESLPLIQSSTTPSELLKQSLIEFWNGLFLAMGIYAAFSVFHLAGQLIDNQTGLNSTSIFNPIEHAHDPITGRLLLMLSVLYFFAVGGHYHLILGLITSFKFIPPGTGIILSDFSLIIEQFSFMFVLAIMIASPIVFGLLILDIIGGIFSRNLPQVSAYFLILPLKIMSGILLLIFMLSLINPMMEKAFALCFKLWPGA